MAAEEKKKTKIDLKARLGKTTQMGIAPPPGAPTPPPPSDSSPGSVPAPATGTPLPTTTPAIGSVRPAPPPSSGGGIPLPPPGISPGIPLPPFAPAQRQAPRAEPKPVAAQQTIKVDVGEEIQIERKKSRTRALGALAVGAVIGLAIGFVAGGASEKGERAKAAAKGAQLLEKDVKAATEKLKALDEKLSDAADKLGNKTFPENLPTDLAGLVIPFESANLDGKGVNGMSPRLFKLVLAFTSGVENLNKSRDSLKNLVALTKEPISKAWKEETAPIANFAILFRTEGKQTVADLVPVAAPSFPWKNDHPEKFKVTKYEQGKPVDKEVKRWVKGDLSDSAIGVDPKTTAAFSSEQIISRMRKALTDMRVELNGNKDNPTAETPGLIKSGEDLANELKKAGAAQQ